MSENICSGLADSNGVLIKVGSKIRKPTDCNSEMHGRWAVYEVKQQGLTPILSYLYSEKGEVLPVGYTASPLCDEYDRKMFCFAKDPSTLRPEYELTVIG